MSKGGVVDYANAGFEEANADDVSAYDHGFKDGIAEGKADRDRLAAEVAALKRLLDEVKQKCLEPCDCFVANVIDAALSAPDEGKEPKS